MGIPREQREPYAKIKLSVLEAALELEKPRQRQEFIYAAVCYMLTGEYPELTKATRPLFKQLVGDFDTIVKGCVSGGRDSSLIALMPGDTLQEKFWNQNNRIISLHNSTSSQPLPTQYSAITQQVLNEYPSRNSLHGRVTTSANEVNPSEAPSDPISTTRSISKAMAPDVGEAVEPPTPEAVEKLQQAVNDPDRVRAFLEYGEAAGWEVLGYQSSELFPAFSAWSIKRRSTTWSG